MCPDNKSVIRVSNPEGGFVLCFVNGLEFEMFHIHVGGKGEPMAAPVICLYDFPSYWKYVDVKHNSVNWHTVVI